MAYGIDVRNEFGDSVFEFQRAMFIKESGLTKTSSDIGMTNSDGFFLGPSTRELYTINQSPSRHPHFIGSGTGRFTGIFANRDRFPRPLRDRSSMVFYQVGNVGLLHHSEHTISPPWNTNQTPEYGMFSMCLPNDNTPLPYFIADAIPQTGLSGNYGMQIKDAQSEILFDSRADFVSISEVLYVPKSAIQNILNNDASIDLSLRTSVPDCYICAPNHTSFRRESGSSARYRHVRIRQTSPTTLRLTRRRPPPSQIVNASLGVNNDLVIIVARNPFA